MLIRLPSKSEKPVFGGAFALADTLGFPLTCAMDEATKRGWVLSIPHYFASAIEHGWDNERALSHIREALSDRRCSHHFDAVSKACVDLFMCFAKPGLTATEIARSMREHLEKPL